MYTWSSCTYLSFFFFFFNLLQRNNTDYVALLITKKMKWKSEAKKNRQRKTLNAEESAQNRL